MNILLGVGGFLLAVTSAALVVTMFEAATNGGRAEYFARFRKAFGGNWIVVFVFAAFCILFITGLRFVILAVFGV